MEVERRIGEVHYASVSSVEPNLCACNSLHHTLLLSVTPSVFDTWWAPCPKDPTGTLTAKTATGSYQPAGSGTPQGTPTPSLPKDIQMHTCNGQHHEGAGQIFLERDPTFFTTSCRFNTEVQPIRSTGLYYPRIKIW